VLKKDIGLASAAAIVIYLMVMIQPAMAQSTDGPRPGDLFSLDQVGQAAGQVLKNKGIYLDSGYLNNILANVSGGNKTGFTSTGEAFVAGHFDMNTIAGIPNAAVHIIFRTRVAAARGRRRPGQFSSVKVAAGPRNQPTDGQASR
jgi:carbohydrate-selective porin OprB